MDTADDLLSFRAKLAGKWDEYRNENTVSGLDNSKKFIGAYLYKRRMIIREQIVQVVLESEVGYETSPPPGNQSQEHRQQAIRDDSVKHQVRCCHCPRSTPVWGPYTPSNTTTSVFLRHFEKHHNDLPRSQDQEDEIISRMKNKRPRTTTNPWTMSALAKCTTRAPGAKFEEEQYRKLLASFIVETNSAFRIVESQAFNNLIQYCNAHIKPISRQTAARDIRALHNELLPVIKARLNAHTASGGKVSLTLDAWTSGNKVPYLGITAHWMDIHYVLQNCVLGFKRLRGSHTAENLASVTHQIISDFNLQDHIKCITADNATVNDCMFKILEQSWLPGWTRKDGHVRCMAHIINLSAQRILRSLKGEALIPEVTLAEAEAGVPILSLETSPASVLKTARKILSKIRASNLLWEALDAQCVAVKIKSKKVLLDMKIRWNSTYDMLERMLYLRPALERLIAFETKLGPSGFVLGEADWDIIQKLCDILKIYVTRTTFLCATSYPTLQAQLPFYTAILRQLNTMIDDMEFDYPALHIACREAWAILNDYWQKVDTHSSQAIALILDPRCKLVAFRSGLSWKDSWIANAKRHFERVYHTQYISPEPLSSQSDQEQFSTHEEDLFMDSIFGPASEVTVPANTGIPTTETTSYLSEPVESDRKVDPIQWWKLHEHRFPNLARMARDHMAVPASSAPSEQLFSRAGDVITKKRNRMLESSCSSILLIKSWLGQPNIEVWEQLCSEWDSGSGWDSGNCYRNRKPNSTEDSEPY